MFDIATEPHTILCLAIFFGGFTLFAVVLGIWTCLDRPPEEIVNTPRVEVNPDRWVSIEHTETPVVARKPGITLARVDATLGCGIATVVLAAPVVLCVSLALTVDPRWWLAGLLVCGAYACRLLTPHGEEGWRVILLG